MKKTGNFWNIGETLANGLWTPNLHAHSWIALLAF